MSRPYPDTTPTDCDNCTGCDAFDNECETSECDACGSRFFRDAAEEVVFSEVLGCFACARCRGRSVVLATRLTKARCLIAAVRSATTDARIQTNRRA